MSDDDFLIQAQDKFNRGAAEHKRPWDAEHIDAISEIKGELYDLYWYAELLPDKRLGTEIRFLAKKIWEEVMKLEVK